MRGSIVTALRDGLPAHDHSFAVLRGVSERIFIAGSGRTSSLPVPSFPSFPSLAGSRGTARVTHGVAASAFSRVSTLVLTATPRVSTIMAVRLRNIIAALRRHLGVDDGAAVAGLGTKTLETIPTAQSARSALGVGARQSQRSRLRDPGSSSKRIASQIFYQELLGKPALEAKILLHPKPVLRRGTAECFLFLAWRYRGQTCATGLRSRTCKCCFSLPFLTRRPLLVEDQERLCDALLRHLSIVPRALRYICAISSS